MLEKDLQASLEDYQERLRLLQGHKAGLKSELRSMYGGPHDNERWNRVLELRREIEQLTLEISFVKVDIGLTEQELAKHRELEPIGSD